MPISIDEFRYPHFVKYKQKNPFTEDIKAKFDDANLNNPKRRYHQDALPQQGYNPNSNTPNVIKVNINKDDLSLPHY